MTVNKFTLKRLMFLRTYQWPLYLMFVAIIGVVGVMNITSPMDSQIFIAICLFLFCLAAITFVVGSIGILITRNRNMMGLFLKMSQVGGTVMFVIIAVIAVEVMNPTNPTVIHTAGEFIKK